MYNKYTWYKNTKIKSIKTFKTCEEVDKKIPHVHVKLLSVICKFGKDVFQKHSTYHCLFYKYDYKDEKP